MGWMESVNEFRSLHDGGDEPTALQLQRAKTAEDAIARALESGAVTAVTSAGAYGDRTTVGVVVAYDPVERVAKLKTRAGTMRVELSDVAEVGPVDAAR
ncbi:YolD-like family protein [Paenibacillus sp. TRM 82003]|nr:YolD-like family protein [Paenibacillus sp. TRM 82003]